MNRSPSRLVLTWALILTAIPCAAGGALAWILGVFPALQLRSGTTAQAASMIHFGLFGWLAAALVLGFALLLVRRIAVGVLLLPVLIGLVWQLAWIAPYYRADPTPHAAPLTVAMVNVEEGIDDPEEFIKATAGADVVVVIEITDDSRNDLAARGFSSTYPHQLHARSGIPGTSIYSRFPMEDLGRASTLFASLAVRVKHPTGTITVLGVHPVNPMSGAELWAEDARKLREWITPHLAEPLVVAGDFNAIDRHAPMRPLLTEDGLRSSADLTGAGVQLTWPVGGWRNGRYAPFPVLGIDHVLVNDLLTTPSHRLFTLSGTDHAGLFVEVARRS